MQNRLPKKIKIIMLACSVILMALSACAYYWARMNSSIKMVHCTSVFESHVDNNSLHAVVSIYLYQGKGSLLIIGDYIPISGESIPIKISSGIRYYTNGTNVHLMFTDRNSSIQDESVNSVLQHLLPFSLNSKNIDYIYVFQRQAEGNYLIKQNGTPLIYCKKL